MRIKSGRILFPALLLAALATPVAAEPTITAITSGTAHRDLYGVAIGPAGSGIAVGSRGTIFYTDDGGKTWRQTDHGTRRALLDVSVSGPKDVIVGQDGLILVRPGQSDSDSEDEWTEVKSGTDQRLLSVDVNQAGFGVAVGTFGTLLVSRDGGESWKLKESIKWLELIEGGYKPHLNAVQVLADGTAVVVGEFGLVVRSTDQGKSWNIVRQKDASLFGLHIRDNGLGYAVGQQGLVIKTTDAGATWGQLEVGSEGNFLGVYAGADGNITVTGMRHMIVSKNGGQTWTPVEDGDVNTFWYLGTTATDAVGMLAVGHTGRVIAINY